MIILLQKTSLELINLNNLKNNFFLTQNRFFFIKILYFLWVILFVKSYLSCLVNFLYSFMQSSVSIFPNGSIVSLNFLPKLSPSDLE